MAIGDPQTHYYRIRDCDVTNLTSIGRAAHFIYLNRYSFNGVFRTNKHGHFNVPKGRNTGSVPSEAQFYRCAFGLRNADLRAADFAECLSDVQRGDFVYLDPPYSTSVRPTYGEYGYGSFENKDLSRLVDCLRQIDAAGAVFLMSYSMTSGIQKEISKWSYLSIPVRRHVAGFSRFRLPVTELLVSNRRLT
jgi:DNA adenine methylase